MVDDSKSRINVLLPLPPLYTVRVHIQFFLSPTPIGVNYRLGFVSESASESRNGSEFSDYLGTHSSNLVGVETNKPSSLVFYFSNSACACQQQQLVLRHSFSCLCTYTTSLQFSHPPTRKGLSPHSTVVGT